MQKNFDVSIVIPAFCEEKRLPRYLKQLVCFCQNSSKKYEIIVIDDDGSVNPEEIEKNLPYLKKGYDIFVGSRVLHNQEQILRGSLKTAGFQIKSWMSHDILGMFASGSLRLGGDDEKNTGDSRAEFKFVR
ncbi:MAG: glycosyltransferase [Candidatus Omnitrophota bacterium]